MKLGLVVFCNDSGLGLQTKRLAEMLRPHRLLAIDSSSFSKNADQHFEWYEKYSGYRVYGFPNNKEIKKFLTGLTHVLCCENPLNFFLLSEAKRRNIKVYIQSNYEFCDHLNNQIELPHKFLMPSYWHVGTMINKFGGDRVEYLPPPINPDDFKNAREVNMNRSGKFRFLHVIGTLAVHDRNGTLDILQALKHTDLDFELVIKSQHALPDEYITTDQRVKYDIGNDPNVENLYTDYDAMILPRRYGGLSLGMNEALMSALPVIMSDIDPNNKVLPRKWLVKAHKQGEFFTRTMIDIHAVDVVSLANTMDWLIQQDRVEVKKKAYQIGYNNYSDFMLRSRYARLWSQ